MERLLPARVGQGRIDNFSLTHYNDGREDKMKLPSAKELYQLYQSGMSMQEIADKLGTRGTSVQRKLKRAGYKTRSLSEAHRLAYKMKRREPKAPSGSNHWAWKGGKESRGYRRKVQKEKCQGCGSRQNLAIHHEDFDHYNNSPDNLMVLCVSCHSSLHKKAYWEAVRAGKKPTKSNGPIGWERK